MYVTYQNFFLFCTFIVALISLLYQIFKGKKQPPLLPIVTADCLQQKFKLIMRGRAASMAFPFSMLNIAHLAAGFKSQTHVYCNVIAKAACCTPFSYQVIPLFRIPIETRHKPLFRILTAQTVFLSCKAVQARYEADRGVQGTQQLFL